MHLSYFGTHFLLLRTMYVAVSVINLRLTHVHRVYGRARYC